MFTKNHQYTNERLKNLLARAAVALKEGPLAEADLATEIETELDRGPVATTWHIGVHAAIERLKEAAQTEHEYKLHLVQEGREHEVEQAAYIAKCYAVAVAELQKYLGER